MGNVLKYEIKKSRFMMLIVGIIIGGLELAYLIGFFGVTTAQNEKIQDIFSSIWVFSIVLLVIAACCSMLVGVLYSVLLYNNDIRKKSGYMLFLTPTPTWQWILAKILMGVLATAALVIAFAILGIADILLFIPELDDTSFIGQLLIPLRDMIFDNVGSVSLFLLNLILQIVVMITTIYLAIAMSKTLLGNKKIGSFVAFVFWIALEILQSAISSLFALLSNGLFSISINMSENGLVYDLDTAIPYLLAAMALNLIFAGVCLNSASLYSPGASSKPCHVSLEKPHVRKTRTPLSSICCILASMASLFINFVSIASVESLLEPSPNVNIS